MSSKPAASAAGAASGPHPEVPQRWWQSPGVVTVLVAIVAAAAPATAAVQTWVQSGRQLALDEAKNRHETEQKNLQLELDKKKHEYEVRQKYLQRVLSSGPNPLGVEKVVLEFIALEDDPQLKKWAQGKLGATNDKIDSKQHAYSKAIGVVAALANTPGLIERGNPTYEEFWSLYKKDLLPHESESIESVMVKIGRLLTRLAGDKQRPEKDLKELENLSYQLARTMKAELRKEFVKPTGHLAEAAGEVKLGGD